MTPPTIACSERSSDATAAAAIGVAALPNAKTQTRRRASIERPSIARAVAVTGRRGGNRGVVQLDQQLSVCVADPRYWC